MKIQDCEIITGIEFWPSAFSHTYPPQMNPSVSLDVAGFAGPGHFDRGPDRLVRFPVKFVSNPSISMQPDAQPILGIEMRVSSLVPSDRDSLLQQEGFAVILAISITAIGGGSYLPELSAILGIYLSLETTDLVPFTGFFFLLQEFCIAVILWRLICRLAG